MTKICQRSVSCLLIFIIVLWLAIFIHNARNFLQKKVEKFTNSDIITDLENKMTTIENRVAICKKNLEGSKSQHNQYYQMYEDLKKTLEETNKNAEEKDKVYINYVKITPKNNLTHNTTDFNNSLPSAIGLLDKSSNGGDSASDINTPKADQI